MNLYEIDQAILNCVDPETGEIVDADKLLELQMEQDKKLEGVALWIKNLKADAAAYKAEKDAFAEREKQAKEKSEKLSEWLSTVLSGEKFQTAKCSVSFRKSESVDVFDSDAIPEEFMKMKIERTPDKVLIKYAIKNQTNVPGCALIEKQNIQIK